MPRHVKPIEKQKLSTLTAKRLLAYRDRLLSLEESPELSDCTTGEVEEFDRTYSWFKSDLRWQSLYDQVREALNSLENVEQ